MSEEDKRRTDSRNRGNPKVVDAHDGNVTVQVDTLSVAGGARAVMRQPQGPAGGVKRDGD